MTNDIAQVPYEPPPTVSLGVITATTPGQLVARATEAADALAAVIRGKKLYSAIQGKQYVRCEGWTTLAAMLGCLPRELSNVGDEDGRYIATVELVRMSDGAVLTRASAECGPDESTWKARSLYARRSMAATRATSKACRLAFSWVMALAGYEVTPAEEIPAEERTRPVKPHVAPTAADLSQRPDVLDDPDEEYGVVPPSFVVWPFAKAVGTLKTGVGIDASIPAEDLRGALAFIAEYIRSGVYTRLVEKKGVKVARDIEAIKDHIEGLLVAREEGA